MIWVVVVKILYDWFYHWITGVYPEIMYSVNWTISYNFINYVFISMVLIHCFFIVDSDKKQLKWIVKSKLPLQGFFFISSMSYWMLGWVQLWFINATKEVWQAGLFATGIYWIHIASLAIGLITWAAIYKFKRTYTRYRYI